jgi:hypothetical protein
MIVQLNNIITGEKFVIKGVKNNNSIEALRYASDTDNVNIGFESIEIEGLQDILYNILSEKLGDWFEPSKISINWLFENELRLLRMTITNIVYASETFNNTEFGQLILQLMTYFKPFVINKNGKSICYLEEIFPQHYEIINPHIIDKSIILEKLTYVEGVKTIVRITDLNQLNEAEL